ncbi:haloacid dehalogenase type II [Poseidonibacter lekithochrous]|uniref:haloacid dehalogenase type II n=1 Tax=Poseidonibacter TaxID=2321187 RepID=UPI001C0A33AE|nr:MULTISPECIES: haloacid dehalogenase type II [Poseidonibacter]MBU3014212.1 haloacid dehalogenase type II [Poseidonibacter lekithochrous]MDO6827509.1 haloacid dehalogenase type II [Poseidonibacter sp. 1_MG-2023]
MAKVTLAFDVYGTLIDTNGVLTLLENFVGKKAKAFSSTWRDKQLEYSFRRGHMQNYVSFAVCTQQALDFTCLFYKEDLSKEQRAELMAIYAILPAFEEVKVALEKFKEKGFRLFAFSNGKKEAVEKLLNNAGIIDLFDGVVSVDDIKTFKPSPGAYAHFLRSANAKSGESWLISSNPFDVTGSISAGMRSSWIKRSEESIFDPWEIQPTIEVNSLLELTNRISN